MLSRGKRIDNGEWIEGFYCSYGHTGDIKHYIIPDYASALYAIEIVQKTLSWCSDAVDKNKTRIFTGDIVRSSETGEIGIVQWFTEHCAFMVWCPASNQVGFLYECAPIVEVIGNIYDNRDILKEISDD